MQNSFETITEDTPKFNIIKILFNYNKLQKKKIKTNILWNSHL